MSDHMSGGDVAAGGSEPTHSSNTIHKQLDEMVQCVASVLEKSTQFQLLSRMPTDVRKRVRALRKLQMQTSVIDMELHKKEFELEKEFQAKHEEIFKKRFEIITGIYEPNDEECDVPDPEILKRIDENTELFAKLKQRNILKDDADQTEIRNIQTAGIPQFWFHILYSNPTLDYLIHKEDEPILKHLIDIRTVYKLEPHFSFTLEFEFSPNLYFENSVLTKEYLLKMNPDDLVNYEGPSIYKTIGCDILWKTGKMVRPSVFDFFAPPQLPEDVLDPSYEEIKNMLENDFEIGDYVKDNIVPKAILYFTGERDDSDLDESLESEDGLSAESDVEEQFEGENTLSM
ncbi:nucleosome assembly protein 1-like 1 [Bradysia coprophila]|uniref:nucleosome assembly protein 1-like 1 n=1 Tax=Bradysia coprophila TaxID=38358 RepID=UPI00187DD965|nr:nucleosome assembly protein 1-like 1 [Bradysia coprophila]